MFVRVVTFSRHIGVHRDAPSLQQPLGDVTLVPIVLAPAAQFARVYVGRRGESQFMGAPLECRRHSGWNGGCLPARPTQVSMSAIHYCPRCSHSARHIPHHPLSVLALLAATVCRLELVNDALSQFIDLVGFHYDFIYLQRTGEFGVHHRAASQ
jgi:hypothetical protein